MCGIAGIISKKGMDISTKLIEILTLIQHRGPDATGIAVYGDCNAKEISLRVSITKEGMYSILVNIISKYSKILSSDTSIEGTEKGFVNFKIEMEDEKIQDLHKEINLIDGLYVHSIGRGMMVYKDMGTALELKENYKIEKSISTHGLGHVRMATESAEDINAAHPFVSPFYPELSIVHNGQLTNYYNLRRYLESKGAIFKTLNDSEAASHFIAYKMMINGGDLGKALESAREELDGIFCIIAATPTQFGFVKDKMGIKPLLFFEKDDVVLFGSEQLEFTPIFPDVYAEEMEPGEVKVWNI